MNESRKVIKTYEESIAQLQGLEATKDATILQQVKELAELKAELAKVKSDKDSQMQVLSEESIRLQAQYEVGTDILFNVGFDRREQSIASGVTSQAWRRRSHHESLTWQRDEDRSLERRHGEQLSTEARPEGSHATCLGNQFTDPREAPARTYLS